MVDTTKKLYRNGVEYSQPDHIVFIEAAEKAGYKVKLKHCYVFSGPCVVINDRKAFMEKTKLNIPLKVEGKGFDIVIRPVRSDELVAHTCKSYPYLPDRGV
jgi:hypothetical protein